MAELCLPPIGSTRPYVDSAFSSKLPFKLSVVLIYSKRLCSHVAGRRLSSYGGPSVDMFPQVRNYRPAASLAPKVVSRYALRLLRYGRNRATR